MRFAEYIYMREISLLFILRNVTKYPRGRCYEQCFDSQYHLPPIKFNQNCHMPPFPKCHPQCPCGAHHSPHRCYLSVLAHSIPLPHLHFYKNEKIRPPFEPPPRLTRLGTMESDIPTGSVDCRGKGSRSLRLPTPNLASFNSPVGR